MCVPARVHTVKLWQAQRSEMEGAPRDPHIGNGQGKLSANVPSAVRMYRVHLRATLLAKVLVRTLTLFNNANASTMLPHTASIA